MSNKYHFSIISRNYRSFHIAMTNAMSYILLFVFLLLVGCATNSLPDSGPSRSDLKSQVKRTTIESLKLVEITSDNIALLGSQRIDSINSDFKNVFRIRKDILSELGINY